MAIPAFKYFILPSLQLHTDGEMWTRERAAEAIADRLKLSVEDRAEILPSQRAPTYRSRINWALTYLFQAGLISRPRRGVCQITQSGRELLKNPPTVLDPSFLEEHCPPFAAFRHRRKPATAAEPAGTANELSADDFDTGTPTERLEAAFDELTTALVGDLLDRVSKITPLAFERLVLALLQAMGYAAGDQEVLHTGQSGDEGIDGIISQDHLGLDRVYVQAKNWENPVSGPDLSKFVGALELQGQGANKGVFVTRSKFTLQARGFAEKCSKRIVLVDGDRLARLMIKFGVGVAAAQEYRVCRVDQDFFEEGE